MFMFLFSFCVSSTCRGFRVSCFRHRIVFHNSSSKCLFISVATLTIVAYVGVKQRRLIKCYFFPFKRFYIESIGYSSLSHRIRQSSQQLTFFPQRLSKFAIVSKSKSPLPKWVFQCTLELISLKFTTLLNMH